MNIRSSGRRSCFPNSARLRALTLACLAPLFLPGSARAAEFLVGRAPDYRPLFGELYRQAIFAESKYVYGNATYDAELAPNKITQYYVVFSREGEMMHIALMCLCVFTIVS